MFSMFFIMQNDKKRWNVLYLSSDFRLYFKLIINH